MTIERSSPPASGAPEPPRPSLPGAPEDDPIGANRPLKAHRTFGRGTLVFAVLITALVSSAGSFIAFRGLNAAPQSAGDEHHDEALYQCPMHPSIVQDHPGDCPICGMKLVKVEKQKAAASSAPNSEKKVLFYRSPMDPKQTSLTPRKDQMGMDYVPVYEGESGNSASTVSGMAAIEIDPGRQQLIGLKTAEVVKAPIGGAWRTVGRVAVDETRVRHVNLKVPGFVQRIYVNYVGKKVKRGDPLFSIYSPELLAAQEEYLLALKTDGALAQAGGISMGENALAAAARRKLELWDISDKDMDALERTRQSTKTLTLYSPISGVVTKKDVVEGMKLDAGAMPYEIVDLSSVWVLADVYESELRFVKDGMAASLSLAAFPNREFKGKVGFVDPLLDPQTRTVKVRLTFANPTGELRPEMFGEVMLFGMPHEALRIPLDAVIDSGTQKIAFVAVGEGKFEPRALRVGESDRSYVEVMSGVSAGERVVTRANFLVDSESRLRASLAESAGQTKQDQPESARVLPGVAPSSSPEKGLGGPAEPSPTSAPTTNRSRERTDAMPPGHVMQPGSDMSHRGH